MMGNYPSLSLLIAKQVMYFLKVKHEISTIMSVTGSNIVDVSLKIWHSSRYCYTIELVETSIY